MVRRSVSDLDPLFPGRDDASTIISLDGSIRAAIISPGPRHEALLIEHLA